MIFLLRDHQPAAEGHAPTLPSPAIGWLLKDGKLDLDKTSQFALQEAILALQRSHSLLVDAQTSGAGSVPGDFHGPFSSPQLRRTTLGTDQGAPMRPGSALPYISPERFAEMQTQRRRDPDYVEKLLSEAKAEFDEKWEVDPTTPTNYDSRI